MFPKILLAVLILILAFFLIKSCHKDSAEEKFHKSEWAYKRLTEIFQRMVTECEKAEGAPCLYDCYTQQGFRNSFRFLNSADFAFIDSCFDHKLILSFRSGPEYLELRAAHRDKILMSWEDHYLVWDSSG